MAEHGRARLGWWQGTLYASGNMAKNILANTIGIFLIFYLTDILGVDAALAGSMILISMVWDAILDPIVGLISDRTKTRWGKYGPLIVVGAPLTALTFAAVFTLPLMVNAKILAVTLCLLAFRTAYTLIDLPHNALISRVSQESKERARLAITRYFFSSLGTLVITLAARHIFEADTPIEQGERFRSFAIFASILAIAVMWASWAAVARRDRDAPLDRMRFASQLKATALLWRSRDALILILVGFISSLAIPAFKRMLSYFAKYNLDNEHAIGMGLLAMVIGQALSTPLWGYLAHKLDKAPSLILAHLISIIGLGAFALTVSGYNSIFLACCFIIGMGAGGIFSIIWAMCPDVIDEIDLRQGIRLEALYIALVIVAMKIAAGLGFGVIGVLLELSGYQANMAQSPETLMAIRILAVALPILGSILCGGALLAYSLSHARHDAIARDLQARR